MNSAEEEPKTLWQKLSSRATLIHIGLIATCVVYVLLGAILFQFIERPIELQLRASALNEYENLKNSFLDSITSKDFVAEDAIDDHIEKLFTLFENPHYAHVFESHFTNYSTDPDLWTFGSAVLFTTTTVIPVGYGHIWPESRTGKILLIVYGIIGIPLILVTMADTGKFISHFITELFNESITIPTVIFLGVLLLYPILCGLYFHRFGEISFLDAIYFSLTSIFTIGFGDISPQVSQVSSIVHIVGGVILVTITIDFVAAELINHVHYMGRGVGKARALAGKMIQAAQNIKVNKGIFGLSAGMAQLQALAKMGMLGRLDKEILAHIAVQIPFVFIITLPVCFIAEYPGMNIERIFFARINSRVDARRISEFDPAGGLSSAQRQLTTSTIGDLDLSEINRK